MKISETELLKDVEDLRKKLETSTKVSTYSKRYIDYLTWSNILELVFDKQISDINPPSYVLIGMNKQDKRDELLIEQTFEKENGYISYLASVYANILKNINFIDFQYDSKDNKYTLKEVKQIILSFFATFDETTYKIAKEAFDNENIHLGVGFENIDACYYNISSQKAKILLTDEKLTLKNMIILVHELGHYIEETKHGLCSSKPSLTYNFTFLEVPSEFYEYEFIKYLLKSHINLRETNNALNDYHGMIDYYFSAYDQLFDSEFIDFSSLIDSIMYSVGSYTALYFSRLRQENKKEFKKRFCHFSSLVGQADFETLIDSTGFSLEEYLSGEYIKPLVKEDFESMKKQYKLKL